jgi:hypothetical protein
MRRFDGMIGQTMTSIEGRKGDDQMRFTTSTNALFMFFHEQGCCENVCIEDVVGDLDDLIGHPILEAKEISSEGTPEPDGGAESFTWTFYRFSTVKGTVTVRWLGLSNGYYSEAVDFQASTPQAPGPKP